MPEGDTVYLAGKRLRAALAGQRLVRGELRHPRLVDHDLAGLTVLDVVSVGKHLFTRLDDGRSLHSHFRMDGSWHLYRPGMAWHRPAYEARAVLATDATSTTVSPARSYSTSRGWRSSPRTSRCPASAARSRLAAK